jgi:hypothetical protein
MKLSVVQRDSGPLGHTLLQRRRPLVIARQALDFRPVEAWMSSEISANGKCLKSKY